MELINEFRVDISMAEAWNVLTDLERIAPMMPGAQLEEVEGDEYRGVVKVKVGPITSQYKGVITFVERDEAAGKVVLRASGRDTKGQGNVSAIITATMTPLGDQTQVSMVTDLTITGKVAQFGRGVLADVSSKLIGQFAESLEADLKKGDVTDEGGTSTTEPSPTPPNDATKLPDDSSATSSTSPGVRRINSPEAQPVDLLNAAGGPVSKYFLRPLMAIGAVVMMVVQRRRRSRD
jgi:hypothetical protein